MRDVDGFAIHERTAPDNAGDSLGLALAHRLLGDAPLAEGPMEPDPGDATVDALPHQVDGDLRMRGDDEPVHGAGKGEEIGERPHALDLWSGGIDGKGLVAGGAELSEDGVGCLVAASGDTGDGDALRAKEISDGVWESGHGLTLLVLRPPACGSAAPQRRLDAGTPFHSAAAEAACWAAIIGRNSALNEL
jgi:hypothetical protein